MTQIIFQIKFPNLFYIENKIGDLQLEIMEKFSQSALLIRRQVVFANLGPNVKSQDIQNDLSFDEETGRKIWQFQSEKNFQLNVLSNSFDITSKYHKTYNLEGSEKFRETIQLVVDRFLKVTSIPLINRIGLRYIDECPIPKKDDQTYSSYYNTTFPLDRFSLSDANEMDFKTMVKRGEYYLRFIESLRKINDEYKLILDFDGFALDISSKDYLNVTDNLHEIISREFENTIKEPVYAYMRGRGGE
ncbi:MAG: TIGR04255 family protein [Theionarchaea archaeon]|nr:TIGR04255 family protein [Theionarchaea archaeon]